jgi:hypothetical protein
VSINLDVASIASAVAGLWAPSGITPPTGLDNVSLSTHLLPKAIVTTPTMLIKPPIGTFEYGPGGKMRGSLDFPAEFYMIEGADIPASATKLYAWYAVLFARPESSYDLDLATSGVVQVTISDSRMGTLTYNSADFVGIAFTVNVLVSLGYNATT